MNQKDAEGKFGALAGMGAYCTEFVLDPYTGVSKWPGILNIIKGYEWAPGGKNRLWIEGVAQGRDGGVRCCCCLIRDLHTMMLLIYIFISHPVDFAAYSKTRSSGVTNPAFAKEAMQVYTEVHQALASGQVGTIRCV